MCNNEFDEYLTENIDNQPLGLYEFTSNTPYVSHEEVRGKIINNYLSKSLYSTNEINTSSLMANKRNMPSMQRNSSSQQSNNSRNRNPLDSSHDSENFGESEENRIEDTYMQELIDKMKYQNSEVNEKILLINEDSKNLIYTILENTVHNIICEAVYGEIDLSEESKIFFFKK